MNRIVFTGAIILFGLSTTLSSSCGIKPTDTIRVAGYYFAIPRENLIKDRPFWLPQDGEEAFLFRIDPATTNEHQVTVAVESPGTFCHTRSENRNGRIKTCGVDAIYELDGHINQNSAQLKSEDRDLYQRVYLDENMNPIVSCFSIQVGENRDGLCVAFFRYKGLICTIRFRESDIEIIHELSFRARTQLKNWERHL